jgi:hypothetical protein
MMGGNLYTVLLLTFGMQRGGGALCYSIYMASDIFGTCTSTTGAA